MTSAPRSPRDEGTGTSGSPSLTGELGRHAGHGLTLAVATLLFAWVGSWADGHLGTDPVLTVVGAVVGFSAGFYQMYRQLTAGADGAAGPEEDP